jgi:hypothetical protein
MGGRYLEKLRLKKLLQYFRVNFKLKKSFTMLQEINENHTPCVSRLSQLINQSRYRQFPQFFNSDTFIQNQIKMIKMHLKVRIVLTNDSQSKPHRLVWQF